MNRPCEPCTSTRTCTRTSTSNAHEHQGRFERWAALALVIGGCVSAPALPPIARPQGLPPPSTQPSLCTGKAPCREQLAALVAGAPDRGDAWRELGWLDYLDGERARAREELRRAARVLPADPRVLLGLALLDDEEGHPIEAMEGWLRILEIGQGGATAPAGNPPVDPWLAVVQVEASAQLLHSLSEAPGEATLGKRLAALDEQRLPEEARERVGAALGRIARRHGDEAGAARIDAAHGCPLRIATWGPMGTLPVLDLESRFDADERDPSEGGALARGRGCFFNLVMAQGRPGVAYAVVYARADRPVVSRVRVATERSWHLIVDGQTVFRQAPAESFPSGSTTLEVALAPGLHRFALKIAAADSRIPVALRLLPAPGLTIVDDAMEGEAPLRARAGRGTPMRAQVKARLATPRQLPLAVAAEQPRLAMWLEARRALIAGEPDTTAELVARLDKEAPRFVPAVLLGAEVDAGDPSRPRRVTRDRARRRYQRALSLDPACLQARLALADQDIDDEHPDRAVKSLGAAPPSESWRLPWLMFRALRAREWNVEAERALAEARRKNPEACTPLEGEVEVAARRDSRRAIAAARALVACNPESSELAEALRRDGGDPAAAATEYRRLLALDPARQSALRGLGESLAATGDAAGAAEVFRKLVALEPRVAGWRRQLADALLGAGDEAGARRAILDGLAHSPEAQELHRALAALGGTGVGPGVMDPFRLDGRKVIADFEKSERRYQSPAVIVLDRTVTRVFSTGARLTLTHNIMRVQTKDGIDKFGEVTVPEGADVLLLRAVKADGSTREAPEIGGKRSVSVPDLAPDDYVEFEYIEPSGPPVAFPAGFYAERFYFQSFDAPLDRTEYVLTTPAGMPLQIDARGGAPVARMESIDDPLGTGTRLEVRTWAAREKAQMLPEPQQAPITEYVPSVRVGSGVRFAGWRDFLDDQEHGTLRANRELRELATRLGSPAAIDQWVRRHIKQGGSLDEPATSVLARGEGSRVVLERAMLAAIGVRSTLWLVRSRADAQLEGPLPDLEGYDEPLLAVERPVAGNKAGAAAPSGPLVLDPRYRHTPTGFVSPLLRGGKALSLGGAREPEARFVTVPGDFTEGGRAARDVKLVATLAADGSADIEVTETLTGRPALEWREGLERIDAERVRSEFEQRTIGFFFPGATLSALEFGPRDDDDVPFVLHYRLHAPRFARDEGDHLVLAAPYAAMLGKRYVGVAERRTPLQLDYTARNSLVAEIRLPPGARVTPSPRISLPGFGEFTQQVELAAGDPGLLRLRATFAIPPERVPAARYPEFVRWADEVDRLEARAAVIEMPQAKK